MKIILEELVKIMERGQITLPIALRKELGLLPKTWLSIKLTNERKIMITPIKEQTPLSSVSFLKQLSQDPTIYWTAADEKRRLKIRQNSVLRLKKQSLK